MNEEMLKEQAKQIRRDIVTMVGAAKSGHPGGSLSAAEILTYLYFEEMNVKPEDPKWADRDRFVLSKGHAAPVLYATLAHKGFFPVEELGTLRKLGSHLQGHPGISAADRRGGGSRRPPRTPWAPGRSTRETHQTAFPHPPADRGPH